MHFDPFTQTHRAFSGGGGGSGRLEMKVNSLSSPSSVSHSAHEASLPPIHEPSIVTLGSRPDDDCVDCSSHSTADNGSNDSSSNNNNNSNDNNNNGWPRIDQPALAHYLSQSVSRLVGWSVGRSVGW